VLGRGGQLADWQAAQAARRRAGRAGRLHIPTFTAPATAA
jgi:hypothetical protein